MCNKCPFPSRETLPTPLLVRYVGVVVGQIANALVAQLAHVHLQREQGEHHQAEDGQRHDLGQLLEAVQQCIYDGFQS